MPNFNPASVTNGIQKLDPRKSPKKGPETCILDKKSGTCWGQMLPAKIREAFGNQASLYLLWRVEMIQLIYMG